MTIYYSTPAMQASGTTPYYLPGELGPAPNHENAQCIKKPNGTYLTVLHTGADAENPAVADQEWFLPSDDARFLIADRTAYAQSGRKAYVVHVVKAA